jgi:hypothetical protein
LPTVKLTDSHNQRELTEGKNISKTTGTKYGLHLTQMAKAMMLPTPTAMDLTNATANQNQNGIGKMAKQAGNNSQLNPRFVAEMMGFPPNWTELPFQNGELKA